MKRYAIVFALVLLALALIGCKGSPLTGKWTGTQSQSGMSMTINMEFSGSDKMTATATLPSDMGTMNISGTYKLEGDVLTVTVADVTLDAKGPQADAMKKAFDGSKSKTIEQMNKDQSGTIKWDGNDKFSVSSKDSKESMTFTRVK